MGEGYPANRRSHRHADASSNAWEWPQSETSARTGTCPQREHRGMRCMVLEGRVAGAQRGGPDIARQVWMKRHAWQCRPSQRRREGGRYLR
eukprot:3325956-Rhodomonas_salina.3